MDGSAQGWISIQFMVQNVFMFKQVLRCLFPATQAGVGPNLTNTAIE